jgi:hypothetical protein
MLNKLKEILSRLSGDVAKHNEPPQEESDDRDAGIPVRVRRDPPGHGSSVAVADLDDDR